MIHSHRWVIHPSLPIQGCKCGATATLSGYQLKQRVDKDGYLLVDCGPKGGRKTCKVHRVILGCFKGEDPREVDHRDRNRANNKLRNLRYLSVSDNRRNVEVKATSESGIRCVRYRKDRDCWQAYAHKEGKFKSLGHFQTAAMAQEVAKGHYYVAQ